MYHGLAGFVSRNSETGSVFERVFWNVAKGSSLTVKEGSGARVKALLNSQATAQLPTREAVFKPAAKRFCLKSQATAASALPPELASRRGLVPSVSWV